MTPESIVVSLALARQLKEEGWPQRNPNPIAIWKLSKMTDGTRIEWGMQFSITGEPLKDGNVDLLSRWYDDGNWFAAPTAAEVIRKIPVEERWKVGYACIDNADEWAALWIALRSKN